MKTKKVDDEKVLLPAPKKKTGPKPGGYNPGAFKRDHDPRRNLLGCYGEAGRQAAQNAMRIARKYSAEHLETLNDIAKDSCEPASARIAAIRELASISGLQKAIERSEAFEAASGDTKALSESDLLAIVNGELREAIDGELSPVDE